MLKRTSEFRRPKVLMFLVLHGIGHGPFTQTLHGQHKPVKLNSVRQSVSPSVCPSVRQSDRPSDRPSVSPSVRPSVTQSVRPSVRQSVNGYKILIFKQRTLSAATDVTDVLCNCFCFPILGRVRRSEHPSLQDHSAMSRTCVIFSERMSSKNRTYSLRTCCRGLTVTVAWIPS